MRLRQQIVAAFCQTFRDSHVGSEPCSSLPDVLLSFLLEDSAQPANGGGGRPPRVGLVCYSFD
jgi:hypothetical protein